MSGSEESGRGHLAEVLKADVTERIFSGRRWEVPKDIETGECHSRTAFQISPDLSQQHMLGSQMVTHLAATFLLC